MRLDDSNPPIDFFISYSPADERWATWIAWQLETAGHRTLLQAWNFVPGTNFIDFMDRGVRDSAVVVAVLSRNYLKSHYGSMEWQAALRTDRTKLITIRIEDCPLEGLLAIRLWDPQSGRNLHTLAGHTRSVWSLAFSPSRGLLATGSDDGTTRLWSTTGDEPVARMTLLGLPEGWAALAPDGRYKLEGNVGGQFWNVINMCRFEIGELDSYLPEVWQLTPETPF